MTKFRNISFLVFLAVSVFVVNVRAMGESCEDAIERCEVLWVGITCAWGFPSCDGGQVRSFYTCEEDDDQCGSPGWIYWSDWCEVGASC